jgi:hypothetical protein
MISMEGLSRTFMTEGGPDMKALDFLQSIAHLKRREKWKACCDI